MTELSCSFCGMEQRVIEKLIAGPSVYLCNRCAEEFDRINDLPAAWSCVDERSSRCSLCNKSRADVARMWTRSGSVICDQCVEIAQDIFWEGRVSPPSMRRRVLQRIARVLGRFRDIFFRAALSARSEGQSRRSRSGHALFNSCLKRIGLAFATERSATNPAYRLGRRCTG